MKKLEIIANKSVEEDLFDRFERRGLKPRYTEIPVVYGEGRTNPKKGDGIWPEENFLLIIYTEDDMAEKIISVVRDLKIDFPDEGIKIFEIEVQASF